MLFSLIAVIEILPLDKKWENCIVWCYHLLAILLLWANTSFRSLRIENCSLFSSVDEVLWQIHHFSVLNRKNARITNETQSIGRHNKNVSMVSDDIYGIRKFEKMCLESDNMMRKCFLIRSLFLIPANNNHKYMNWNTFFMIFDSVDQ